MESKLNTIIKIETEKSNKLMISYFIGINLTFIFISILFYEFESSLYLQHTQYHLLFLGLFLLPLKYLSIKIDHPIFFKYIFAALYIVYILSLIVINNYFDIISLILLLNICFLGLIYMSSNLYLVLSALIIAATMFFSYFLGIYNTELDIKLITVYRTILVAIILLGGYVGLTRILAVTKSILEDESSPFIDALTGAYNKHYLKEKIISMAQSDELQLSVIVLGIDNMKEINKNFGFSAGDAILQGLTNILGCITRNSDSICRTDGDKFAIIVQHPKEFQAYSLAERIKYSLEHEKFNIIDKNGEQADICITASFGVVTLKEGENSDNLLARAEKALLRAKKGGKNNIEEDN